MCFCIPPQPGESIRGLKLLRKRPAARRGDVDRVARMVLAVPGRRTGLEYFINILPAIELVSNQVGLILNAPKSRHDQQANAIIGRRFDHFLPLGGRSRVQPLHPANQVRPNVDEIAGFCEFRQVPA